MAGTRAHVVVYVPRSRTCARASRKIRELSKYNYQSCVAKKKGFPSIMTTHAEPRMKGLLYLILHARLPEENRVMELCRALEKAQNCRSRQGPQRARANTVGLDGVTSQNSEAKLPEKKTISPSGFFPCKGMEGA